VGTPVLQSTVPIHLGVFEKHSESSMGLLIGYPVENQNEKFTIYILEKKATY
jgi:hypothetical protein